MKNVSTKKALVLALLSTLLCVSMLVGTTFAWFTDTASTAVNKIQAGNLKVELVKEDGSKLTEALKWVSAEEGATILWEPGCTYNLEGFRVKNSGTLALKYKVVISGVDGDAKLLEALTFTYKVGEETFTSDSEFKLAAGETSPVFAISAHMDETAGNEYKELELDGITITVYATQDTVENDSNGNDYDADATLDFVSVSSADELKEVFAAAKEGEPVNVSLNGDVTIDEKAFSALNGGTEIGDITIQGNGHTITNNNTNSVRGLQIANSSVERTVTICNVNLELTGTETAFNAKENRGVQLYGLENTTVNLINCDINMTATDYSYAVKVINSKNVTINMTGCTLTSANCIETNGAQNCTFNITNCVFNSNYAVNTQYCGNGIQDKNGTNNTFNIKNTTFNGTNAQQWESGTNSTFNDLGGNVNNTVVSPKN